MSVLALFTWIVTALGGLFLLAIWLIEYDPEFQRAAATRLPIPVISGHVLCAVSGLAAWILYLVTDKKSFAWATVVLLGGVAVLGITMAVRWLGVYRSSTLPGQAPGHSSAQDASLASPADAWTQTEGWTASGRAATMTATEVTVPPERHFPLTVVIGHGVFALTTIVLVVLTVVGVAGS
jgi:hypothetical protein